MTSIFTVMTQLARQHNAINLAQGFPNFDPDPRLVDSIARLSAESVHQYMPSAGYLPLLEKISGIVFEHYQRKADPNTEILVTAGATQGIFTAVQALVKAGDDVVILDPAYDCYDMPVNLIGARPVHVALNADFLPDWDKIRTAMSANTRMIIINNPHNPSGKIWTLADFESLEKLLDDFPRLLVLSDEVYEFIAFEMPHISVNSREKLRHRSIVVSSFGKSFHITGWKVGYLIADELLMEKMKQVHQFLVFSVNSLAQVAISEYLNAVDVTELSPFYLKKRNYFRHLMEQTGLKLLPCEGTFFQLASFAGISTESDIDFTKRLVTEFGVAAIPLSVFNADGKDDKLIRFCFAKDDQTLEQAAEKLRRT